VIESSATAGIVSKAGGCPAPALVNT